MNDLTQAYGALQKADAAGDTQAAKQIADYIRSNAGAHRFGSGRSFDVTENGLVPTGSPEALAAQSPVSGNGFLKNTLIGSGKAFTDMGLGMRQLYALVADKVSPTAPTISNLVSGTAPQSRTALLEQEALDKRMNDAALMKTGGGKVGGIGTGIATALPLAAIPGAGTYVGAATIGGAYGALTPTTANDSRALNTGIGAGLGAAGKFVGDTLGRFLTSRANPTPALTPAQENAAAAGQNLGMEMTPGQQSGSRSLQQLEAKLESQPWTSGPFNTLKRGNQEVLNSTATSAIGEAGPSLDSSVLAQASDRLGSIFETVRSPNNIVAADAQATTSALDTIDQQVRGLLPGGTSIRSNPLVSDFESLAQSGSINGEQLGSLSSKLGKAAYKQMSTPAGDRDWGQALYAVKDHVDDLIQQSLSPAQAAEYAAARGQYRNLMLLTSRTGIVNPSSGNVSGAALANKLQQSDRQGFLFGRNQTPMYNAARFAQAFKPIVGDSGTATRSSPNLGDMTLGVLANIGSRAYLSRPGSALARTAVSAGALAPPLSIGRAITPYIQSGLPGLGGQLVPYLTQ